MLASFWSSTQFQNGGITTKQSFQQTPNKGTPISVTPTFRHPLFSTHEALTKCLFPPPKKGERKEKILKKKKRKKWGKKRFAGDFS